MMLTELRNFNHPVVHLVGVASVGVMKRQDHGLLLELLLHRQPLSQPNRIPVMLHFSFFPSAELKRHFQCFSIIGQCQRVSDVQNGVDVDLGDRFEPLFFRSFESVRERLLTDVLDSSKAMQFLTFQQLFGGEISLSR